MHRSTRSQRGVVEIILTILLVVGITTLIMTADCIGRPGDTVVVREPEPVEDPDWDDDDIWDDDDAGDDDDVGDDDDATGSASLSFSVVIEIPELMDDEGRDDDDSAADDDDSAADDDDSATDDDDSATDDDDSAADDDDSATDDDDSVADDDDSATDDDDVAPDDDDSAPLAGEWEVTATFRARWSGEDLSCETEVVVEGLLMAGEDVAPDGCLDCAGRLIFDPETTDLVATDCEDPPSDPMLLVRLLTTLDDGFGVGDFLDLALMRADTMTGLELDLATGGGMAAADLEELLGEQDLDFTHAGFVDAIEGTLLQDLGADLVLAPPQPDSTRLGFWAFGVDAGEPPPGEEGYPGLLYGVTTLEIIYY